jgi:hypothetical protein
MRRPPLPHALHPVDLLEEFFCRGFLLFWLFFIGFVHLIQVAVNVFVQFLDCLLELLLVDILGAAVDGFELTAIDGDQVPTEEFQLFAEEGELSAHMTDGLSVVSSEVGDGLEIRGEVFDELHDSDVTMGFPFQLTAGADAVEIAIDIQLQ